MATQPPPTPRVLILGHSFIRRLKAFIEIHPTELDLAFQISAQAAISWRGVGGRTVAQAIQYDMKLVRSQCPDIVVVQLGTNDLSSNTSLLAEFLSPTFPEEMLIIGFYHCFKIKRHFRGHLSQTDGLQSVFYFSLQQTSATHAELSIS